MFHVSLGVMRTSISCGVDPARKVLPIRADLRERRAANERLLPAADDVVTYLAREFAGTGHVIVVADAEGTKLEVAGDLDGQRRLAKNARVKPIDVLDVSGPLQVRSSAAHWDRDAGP
jgi:hypothetical protein